MSVQMLRHLRIHITGMKRLASESTNKYRAQNTMYLTAAFPGPSSRCHPDR
jgi:hypothetical protein